MAAEKKMPRAAEPLLLPALGAQGVPKFQRAAQAGRKAVVAVQPEQMVPAAGWAEEVEPGWRCSD